MDYTGVTPEEDGDTHDGGILHEGKEGDINISGGVINLTGEAAKSNAAALTVLGYIKKMAPV